MILQGILRKPRVVEDNGDTRKIKNGELYSVETKRESQGNSAVTSHTSHSHGRHWSHSHTTYSVKKVDSQFEPSQYDTILAENSKSYTATDAMGNSRTLKIRTAEITQHGQEKNNRYAHENCEGCFISSKDIGEIKLDKNTDIEDINSIRYQLGKMAKEGNDQAKQFANFIDKFVIVSPEEKKAYKDY